MLPSKKIAWCTDIHLDWEEDKLSFLGSLDAINPDYVFLTGDIAEGHSIEGFLTKISDLRANIYFILGNHDYFGSSFTKVRAAMVELCDKYENLHWLPNSGVVELTKGVGLVGVDGWYDARCGATSPIKFIMNDWRLIEELKPYEHRHIELVDKIREIADKEVKLAKLYLREAASNYNNVFFLTHVPPWREAAWYGTGFSENAAAPWFCSVAMGEMIEDIAQEFPLTNFEVFAGHTHSHGVFYPASNVKCTTGMAVYGKPIINEIIALRERF